MSTPSRRSAISAALAGRGLMARMLAGMLLVLQVFVVGAVPVLDAGTDHTEQVVIHIEDAQNSDCPASHDAEDCQLCQALSSLRAIPGSAGALPQPTGPRAVSLPMDVLVGAPALVFLSGNSSRAPPRA
jgi:hypothetical protein